MGSKLTLYKCNIKTKLTNPFHWLIPTSVKERTWPRRSVFPHPALKIISFYLYPDTWVAHALLWKFWKHYPVPPRLGVIGLVAPLFNWIWLCRWVIKQTMFMLLHMKEIKQNILVSYLPLKRRCFPWALSPEQSECIFLRQIHSEGFRARTPSLSPTPPTSWALVPCSHLPTDISLWVTHQHLKPKTFTAEVFCCSNPSLFLIFLPSQLMAPLSSLLSKLGTSTVLKFLPLPWDIKSHSLSAAWGPVMNKDMVFLCFPQSSVVPPSAQTCLMACGTVSDFPWALACWHWDTVLSS